MDLRIILFCVVAGLLIIGCDNKKPDDTVKTKREQMYEELEKKKGIDAQSGATVVSEGNTKAIIGNIGKDSERVDAITSASKLPAYRLDISKEEGYKRLTGLLRESGPYILSNIENGKPRMRPLSMFVEYDGKIWFHLGTHKYGYTLLQQDPYVEVAAILPGGEGWIRITAKVVCVFNAEVDKETFVIAPHLKDAYNEKTGKRLGHFYLTDGVAEVTNPDDSIDKFYF